MISYRMVVDTEIRDVRTKNEENKNSAKRWKRWRLEGGRESMGARICGRYLKIREQVGKEYKDSRERGKEKFCDDL